MEVETVEDKHVSTADLEESLTAALFDIGCDIDRVVPADDLVCDLGMDSTEIVELGIVLREKYGLSVRVDLRGLQTAGDVVEKMQRLLAT